MSNLHPWSLSGLIIVSAVLLSVSACSKDEEASAALQVVVDTAAQVVEKATSSADRSQALKDAQTYLDSQRDTLAQSAERLKSLKGYQVSDETVAKIKSQMREAGATITSLRVQLADDMARDSKVDDAVEALIRTFTNAVQGTKAR